MRWTGTRAARWNTCSVGGVAELVAPAIEVSLLAFDCSAWELIFRRVNMCAARAKACQAAMLARR
eukprot:2043296-Pyramimonas_sp.AAC.1